MSKIFNRALQISGENKVVGASQTYITVINYDNTGMITAAKGATVPTDADAGYAVGCTFVDTTSGAGATFYVNEGSTTSCDFNIAAGESTSAAHAMLSATHSDSTAAAVARGAIITGQGSTPKWTKLTIGTTGYTLISDGTDLAWGQVANAGISSSAAIAYSKLATLTSNYILAGVSNVATVCSVAGDLTMTASGTAATFAIASGAIVNDDVNAAAGITVGKLALTTGSIILGASSVGSALDVKGDGKIIVGNGTTATSVSVSGDCTLINTGAMTVTDLTISGEAAGDILYFNGSNWIRLAKPGSSGYFLEGGTTPAWSLPSLASASSIQTGATLLDAGANDATITFTTQTTGGASVVIPDFNAAAAFTFGFLSKVQTWSANQTIQYGNLLLGDNDNGQTLQILVNENMTGNKTLTIQPNDTNRTIHLHGDIDLGGTLTTLGAWTQTGAHTIGITTTNNTTITLPITGTLTTLDGSEVFTNKTLTSPTLTTPRIVTTGYIADAGGDEFLLFVESGTPVNYIQIQNADTTARPVVRANGSDDNIGLSLYGKGTGKVTICDSTTVGKALNFDLSGATDTKTMTILSSHNDDRTLTLPNATDTLVGKATSDTLTNKTIDCDGTGNVITNVNANELDPITPGSTYGIPFIYTVTLNADGGDVTVVSNSAFKFRVIDAWSQNNSGAGGTWSLKTDSGKCTNDVTVAANDTDIDRIGQLIDSTCDVAATTGDLYVTNDTVVGTVYISCLRIN